MQICYFLEVLGYILSPEENMYHITFIAHKAVVLGCFIYPLGVGIEVEHFSILV